MKLIIATKNLGKLKEFKEELEGLNLEIFSIKDIDSNIEIEENGKTYEENAMIKAKKLCEITNEICIGDDSGLEIDALPGELGIYTARFLGEETTYEEKMGKILKRMVNVPFEERKAVFKCSLVICFPDGRTNIISGENRGYIHDKMVGAGFGFDPIFYVKDYQKTYGEMDLELKNKISHRGIALYKLKEYLKEIGNI